MQDDYLKRITNYIFDNRFSRALLIDGDWGCGKSFFVKNILIPELENTKVKEKKENENLLNDSQEDRAKNYSALMISLYGISNIESIQSAIYSACLEKMTDKTGNHAVKNVLNHATLLGTTVLKGISSHFGVETEVGSLLTQIGDGVLAAKKEDIILIFDDIERCRVDIIELMGFFNNLCENSGYRIILIANEDEIARQENDIALAIQTQTALIDLYGKQFHTHKNNKSKKASSSKESNIIEELHHSRTDVKDETMKSSLENHRNMLFERNTLYERTREKLIGLTVRFSARINDVYEDVLKKTIPNGAIRRYLLDKKSFIVEAFGSQSHENIRTLISLFISVEAIMTALKVESNLDNGYKESVDIEKIIEEEKDRLLLYLIRTAIDRSNGINLLNLNNGIRYGFVNKGLFSNEQPYFKYDFVDEYWNTLVPDSDVINTDFNSRIGECVGVEIDRVKDKQHSELALFRLREWYYYSDEEVKENIEKLKAELKEKKYYPYEFKEIIQTLMRINYPECGMRLKKPKEKTGKYFYDSSDDTTLPVSDSREEIQNGEESSNNIYNSWNQENIDEYVNLMMKYTEDDDFSITDEMLRVLSEDLSYIQEYKGYIKPLLDWIYNKELSDLKKSDGGKDAFEIKGSELYSFFQGRRDTYLTKRQFLSLYGYNRIESKIKESETKYLWELADAIHTVYNFGNLRDFLSEDYDTVNQIWQDLKKDRETGRSRFNPLKERTREMALRRLETDFESYRNQLRDINGVIEERIEEQKLSELRKK